MVLSLDIVTFHDSLEMYGNPDPSSAYSLSGHVSITLRPTSKARKPVHLLLKSLMLTFEGQTELISPFSGYVPLRLCAIQRELAPSDPFEISNEGYEDDRMPITWNVVFNLAIPGWLPATSTFGDANGGTRYALYATAEFANLEEKSCGGKLSFFSGLCSSFFSRAKTVEASSREVVIKRYVKVPSASSSTSQFPSATYIITSDPSTPDLSSSSSSQSLPSLKFSMFALSPECVDVNDSSVPLSIRLCAEGLDAAQYTDLQVSGFAAEVEQREDYRAFPSPSYASKFPLPPPEEQPPDEPLLNPNSAMAIYELGYVPTIYTRNKTSRFISLQHPSEPIQYTLGRDTCSCASDGPAPERSPTWHTIKTSIPFTRAGLERNAEAAWGGDPLLRPSANSPLMDVSHSLHICITCTYTIMDPTTSSSRRATERLNFALPLRFVELAPASLPPSPSLTASSGTASPSGQGSSVSTPQSVPSLLPPYSQLYEPDGERKIDWDSPLPVYEPQSSSSSSSLLDLDLGPMQLTLLENLWPPLDSQRV